MNKFKVDINCDMGESFGVYNLGMDEEIIKYISSANIACGFHAGDPSVMDETVKMAVEQEVMVGAHPSFRDLVGFGRRKIEIEPKEVKKIMIYQIGALQAFAKAHNLKLQHVKPHGSLNNMASTDYDLALAIAEAIKEVDENLIFVALGGSAMYKAANNLDLRVASEVFADRAYNLDGTLVSRKIKGAVIEDPTKVKKRVLNMIKNGEVKTINGEILRLKADTVCVHGDNPSAIKLVKELVKELEKNKIEITAMKNIV
ncbi:MAG TPA: 5-oxoprolinase subunit PxpA [Halanaerobiales bacterium]|nr:5-oxoprolinase subunit PxpA [Halanaerobiales bacterium]